MGSASASCRMQNIKNFSRSSTTTSPWGTLFLPLSSFLIVSILRSPSLFDSPPLSHSPFLWYLFIIHSGTGNLPRLIEKCFKNLLGLGLFKGVVLGGDSSTSLQASLKSSFVYYLLALAFPFACAICLFFYST